MSKGIASEWLGTLRREADLEERLLKSNAEIVRLKGLLEAKHVTEFHSGDCVAIFGCDEPLRCVSLGGCRMLVADRGN